MTRTPGMTSARDLFAKLQRDAALLDEMVTSDRFFNFVVTGWSLKEWVRNDPTVPSSAKTKQVLANLHKDKWFNICREIANASKHYELNEQNPVTMSATSRQGYGLGRFGKGNYGVGEESIIVQLNPQPGGGSSSIRCLDLVQGVLTCWETFFATHSI